VPTALIVGATGLTGEALTRHLAERPEWSTIGVARRRPAATRTGRFIELDATDGRACREAFAALSEVTHVFFTAFLNGPSWPEMAAPNAALLRNVVEAIEPAAPGLERIVILQGTKYYGMHLGPFRTPAKESDPRHMPPSYYYEQQDFLAERCRDKSWSWAAARPHVICGIGVGSPQNLIAIIGVYAAISKALGLPLRFPGKPGAYSALYQATDAELLAKALAWMAVTPACANQAFNVTNGDFFRHENLWPGIAELFGIPSGPVQTLELQRIMPAHAALWDRLTETHGLKNTRFGDLVDWRFADYAFASDWDVISDTLKCRQHGFLEFVDSEAMVLSLLDRLREERIVP
jgi:nucleoside-diphosphate-sugar epimerase